MIKEYRNPMKKSIISIKSNSLDYCFVSCYVNLFKRPSGMRDILRELWSLRTKNQRFHQKIGRNFIFVLLFLKNICIPLLVLNE